MRVCYCSVFFHTSRFYEPTFDQHTQTRRLIGGIVAPIFDDQHDVAALQQLQVLFPERKVIGVPGREILLGGGNIHCITQQQPAP
ncbi:MAG: hypothetical protein DPW16_04775 [Chloroflexi bacterium]|nr:hypothetical protein [Chloroflexota bacterium]